MELFVVLCLFGFVSSSCNEDDLRRIDSIYSESDCSSAGGQCTVGADCPPGSLAGRGLCPQQQRYGVECCNGISVKETRCQKLGGECFPNCKRNLLQKQAKDCPQGRVCCTLL